MSAHELPGDPQHQSGGTHRWLCYTNSDGEFIASENTQNTVGSFGPTYGEVYTNYLTDDGNIKVSYKHTEFPQTDENRAFYEIKYEVLGDVSIDNFKEDFYFYRVTDNDSTGVYQHVGYLNEANECTVVEAITVKNTYNEYILGDEYPYFSFFNMKDWSSEQGYVNLSFLIKNAEFIINGEKSDAKFVLLNEIIDGSNYLRLSLDLGKVTLKAGDTFEINAIVMPWGSEKLSEYYDENGELLKNPDENVRRVRRDTLLTPLTVTAIENAKVIEDEFIPKIKSTNGKSAEFKLVGGQNNVAVHVYGFEKLTVPVVEELVGAKWEKVELSSAYKQDTRGNGYFYDGYCVYYDEETNSFSYSFIVEMDFTKKRGRTFRVTVTEDFTAWPDELPKIETDHGDLPLNVYIDMEGLRTGSESEIMANFGDYSFNEEEKYVSLISDGRQESYFSPFLGGTVPTGYYFVMKYRLPDTNPNNLTYFELFTSTKNSSPAGEDVFGIGAGLMNDGEWHILVADLSTWNKASFAISGDGTYQANFIRLDPFNENFPAENVFDLGFVGMADNLNDIYKLAEGYEAIQMLSRVDGKTTVSHIDPASGDSVTVEDPNKNPSESSGDATSAMPGYNVYLTPSDVISKAQGANHAHAGTSTLMTEDGVQFARFGVCNDQSRNATLRTESTFKIYDSNSGLATGQYIVIKYRAFEQTGYLQFYTSTTSAGASEKSVANLYGPDSQTNNLYVADGKWHLVVIDLSKIAGEYTPDANGKYAANFVRFDMFNLSKPAEAGYELSLDVAYIGMTDDFSEIVGTDRTMESLTFYDGTATVMENKSGAAAPEVGDATSAVDGFNVYLNPTALLEAYQAPNQGHLGKSEMIDNGSAARFHICTDTTKGEGFRMESYFKVYSSTGKATGQYLVLKYRTEKQMGTIQFYISTVSSSITESNAFKLFGPDGATNQLFKADGEWHTVIIDASKVKPLVYAPDANGKYVAQIVRLDLFNLGSPIAEGETAYVDLGLFGICDDYTEILDKLGETSDVWLYDGTTSTKLK